MALDTVLEQRYSAIKASHVAKTYALAAHSRCGHQKGTTEKCGTCPALQRELPKQLNVDPPYAQDSRMPRQQATPEPSVLPFDKVADTANPSAGPCARRGGAVTGGFALHLSAQRRRRAHDRTPEQAALCSLVAVLGDQLRDGGVDAHG